MSWRKTFARLGDAVLDPTIAGSFGRGGFNRHRVQFEPDDLASDLTGRICAVTGANGGLGYATAAALGARNATVWLLCRNAERGQRALETLRTDTGNANIHLALLDVSSLEAIRRFTAAPPMDRLDVLVNNFEEPCALYENLSDGERGLIVRLRGQHSEGYGCGARVTAELPDGRRLVREMSLSRGYLSGQPPELHFGLGDAEAVHAGTNDLDRLCELLVSDLGSFDDGLRHQDHLGAALKVEAEADRGIGARPKGPDDATDEQDDQGDQRSPWLRCCRWCHRSPRMRTGFQPAGCRLSRSATALRLPPEPSRH